MIGFFIGSFIIQLIWGLICKFHYHEYMRNKWVTFWLFPFGKKVEPIYPEEVSGAEKVIWWCPLIPFGGMGLVLFIESIVATFMLCVSIIGIPYGLKMWQFKDLALVPWAHEVTILEDE